MIELLASVLFSASYAPMNPPAVGEKAPPFSVSGLHGGTVTLSKVGKPFVLVVLRGWPGYQCPFCTAQVGEYIAKADEFAKAKANVLFVYPGPSEGLQAHTEEFIAKKEVPKGFAFALDPDYRFAQTYGLRWDAPNETAYPSTFVIGRDGRVKWAKISHEHGDRAASIDVLAALKRL